MYNIQIYKNGEKLLDADYEELYIRQARGLTTIKKKGNPVQLKPNNRKACELKLWSGILDFTMGNELHNEIEE